MSQVNQSYEEINAVKEQKVRVSYAVNLHV